MSILALAFAAFLIGIVAILVTVYVFLAPRMSWFPGPPMTVGVLCKHCLDTGEARRIRACNHVGGVPSTWHHKDNGAHFCRDGIHFAEHI
jgi:hypothetical protein